jgi:hypothetical protein
MGDYGHRGNRQNGTGYPFPSNAEATAPGRNGKDTGVDMDPDKADDAGEEKPKNLSWSRRMKHVTWAWFTLTMATGGIANVLHTGT